jgi:hypothetical protein
MQRQVGFSGIERQRAVFTPVMVRRIQRKKITVGDDRTIAARGKIADSSTGP